MKKFCFVLILCSFFVIASTAVIAAYDTAKVSVLVSFKGKIQPKIIEMNQGKVKDQLKNASIVVAEVPKNALENLKKNKDIEFIEEDGTWSAMGQTVPWGVTDIRADLVQASGITGKEIKVGILDSGIAPHEDLNVTGGWNFVNNSANYTDDFGHGTHVVGTIAALNNTIGVVGVAPDVQLYSLKVLDNTGNTNWSTVVKAIDWAITNKMQVLNMSFGGNSGSKTIEKLLNKAYSSGILLIAAAGNNGNSSPVIYPANYGSVIAVGATDQTDNIASFSSTGNKVEVVAPGVDILSTYPGNNYTTLSGTSMATPHVTGAAALIWCKSPGLTNIQVRNILDKSAIDLGTPGRDTIYGYGLVSPYIAIK